MHQVTPFSSTLWVFNLGYNYEAEIETCYKIKEKVASVHRSNVGGYQSDFINLIDLFPCISKKLFPVLDALAVQHKMQGSVNSAWLNINPKHTHNVCHTHSHGSLSGVMYLSTNKKSGDIVFYNPAPIQHYPTINKQPRSSTTICFYSCQWSCYCFPILFRTFCNA